MLVAKLRSLSESGPKGAMSVLHYLRSFVDDQSVKHSVPDNSKLCLSYY